MGLYPESTQHACHLQPRQTWNIRGLKNQIQDSGDITETITPQSGGQDCSIRYKSHKHCLTPRRAGEGLLSKVVSQSLSAAVQDNVAALLISSILVLAGVTVARFFREASLLAAFFLVGFIGLELTLLFLT